MTSFKTNCEIIDYCIHHESTTPNVQDVLKALIDLAQEHKKILSHIIIPPLNKKIISPCKKLDKSEISNTSLEHILDANLYLLPSWLMENELMNDNDITVVLGDNIITNISLFVEYQNVFMQILDFTFDYEIRSIPLDLIFALYDNATQYYTSWCCIEYHAIKLLNE